MLRINSSGKLSLIIMSLSRRKLIHTRLSLLSFLGTIVITYPASKVDSRMNPFLSYFFTYSLMIFAFSAKVLRSGFFVGCLPSISGITWSYSCDYSNAVTSRSSSSSPVKSSYSFRNVGLVEAKAWPLVRIRLPKTFLPLLGNSSVLCL
jgi:hypothetical protein